MICIYSGSFDPPTLGHLDIIDRASKIFEKIVVALPENGFKKNFLFNINSRIEMMNLMINDKKKVLVKSFDGLLVDFVKKNNVKVIIRGIRDSRDFFNEQKNNYVNKNLNSDIETMFFISNNNYSHISSRLVKELLKYNCENNILKKFLHSNVINYINSKKILN
jgi:pantetheine-phosphate adenylyltransferase